MLLILIILILISAFAQPKKTTLKQPDLGCRSVKILEINGLKFKDLNRNGILDKYEEYKNKEIIGRANGSDEAASQADTSARRLWTKNSALVKRIQSGNLTPNGAAKIIFDDWKNKGIEGGKPSIKTISNWYKRIRPN